MTAAPAHPQRPAVDWARLHERLALAARRLAGPAADADTTARVLRARARAAAREPQPDAGTGAPPVQVVEFQLAYERYAIDVRWMREVVALRDLTPLPGTPAFVAGLVNVRGRVVSVVDMKAFFDLPPKGLPDLNRVLVVADERLEFGLLVDAVLGVAHIGADQIHPPLPTHTGVRERYLRGLTADRLAVLDGARLLADPRIVVNQATRMTRTQGEDTA
jgi:purine-binding chemotaxis protein CheW